MKNTRIILYWRKKTADIFKIFFIIELCIVFVASFAVANHYNSLFSVFSWTSVICGLILLSTAIFHIVLFLIKYEDKLFDNLTKNLDTFLNTKINWEYKEKFTETSWPVESDILKENKFNCPCPVFNSYEKLYKLFYMRGVWAYKVDKKVIIEADFFTEKNNNDWQDYIIIRFSINDNYQKRCVLIISMYHFESTIRSHLKEFPKLMETKN